MVLSNTRVDHIEHRIIPKLEIKNGFVVKGLMMEGVQKIGDPLTAATQYYETGADELILLDTVASLYQRHELPKLISELVESTFSPICAGGGVATLESAERLFWSGADKVAVNTAGVENPSFLNELAKRFGSQSIVAQVDVKFYHGQYWVFTLSGREKSQYLLNEWLDVLQDNGVGEILLTSIDKDGMCRGPDFALLETVVKKTNVPLIYGGGIRNAIDIARCFGYGVQACAIAASLHYNDISIPDVRRALVGEGWNVRPMIYGE